MSTFILKSITIALLFSFVISDPDNEECQNVIFNCDCGTPGYKFLATFKQCGFWNPPESACGRFSNCLDCEDGVDRCISCPQGRYGRLCRKKCDCVNGSTCDKENGLCICPPGYKGERCNTRKGITAGELNCNTKANTLMKNEKNLQINATCPSGCKEANGDVWGTSIYTEDSSVCRAAIHARLLNNNGGKVTIVDNGFYSKFIGTSNEISSKSMSRKLRSFRFESFERKELQLIDPRRSTCPDKWNGNQDGCILTSTLSEAWKISDNCIQ